MDKKLLEVPEAGAILSLGRSTIYSLLMKGELRSIVVGRRRLIPVESIDSFIADRLGNEDAHPDQQ